MEFKGTKGKWQVSQPDGKSITAKSDNGIGYEVVVVQGGFMSKYSKIAKANALLASKAPEMLEMLKILIQDIEEEGNYFRQTGYDIEEAKKLIESATTI